MRRSTSIYWSFLFKFQPLLVFLLVKATNAMAQVEPMTNDTLMYAISRWQSNPVEARRKYGGKIERWDTSKVTYMYNTFIGTINFTADLSAWDVSSVTDMNNIFYYSKNFGGNVSTWNTTKVMMMMNAFQDAVNFTADLSAWDLSSVTTMGGIFDGSKYFGADVSTWDTSHVRYMSHAFHNTINFTADVSTWDVSSVTSMSHSFYNSTDFGANVSAWNTSNVRVFTKALYNASWFNITLCWDLRSADPETLKEFSCFTQGGLDCSCLHLHPSAGNDTNLTEIINSDCPKPTPPCHIHVASLTEVHGNNDFELPTRAPTLVTTELEPTPTAPTSTTSTPSLSSTSNWVGQLIICFGVFLVLISLLVARWRNTLRKSACDPSRWVHQKASKGNYKLLKEEIELGDLVPQ